MSSNTLRWRTDGGLLSLALIACHAAAAAELDPAKVVGSDTCLKCHASEVKQWHLTPHAQTIDTLHRNPNAKEITKRLGLRSVKRNDTCVQCHYTRKQQGSRVRIDSGVSCESCHGAARDWLDVHAEYGPGVTRQTESAEHRAERRKKSIALGMNNPSNLYLIAKQCLACHTTPEERLVDEGGHPAGSLDFDLVAWSQGTVRHNFVRSDGAVNEVSSPARLRVMHVVGLMADLEHSLRACATATRAGTFGQTAGQRAATKKRVLVAIQQRIHDPHVAKALEAVAKLELRLDNREAILAAANTISEAAFAFAEQADGEGLASIDEMLPPPNQFR